MELGAHLHARPAADRRKGGCGLPGRAADAWTVALGGQGGCPFAQDALVGNIATEAAFTELSNG